MAPWSYWSAPNPGVSVKTLAQQVAKQGELLQKLVGQGNGRRGAQNQKAGATEGGSAIPNRKVKTKWCCLLKSCTKSANGALNNANRTECFGCGNPKGYCCSPPAALCRTTAQEALAEAKLKEKAKAGEAPAPAAPKAKAKPPAAAHKEEEKAPLADLPEVPTAPAISDFVKSRVAPPLAVVVKTAEECLLGVAPKDRAHDLALARDDVTHWQSALDSAKKGAAGSTRLNQAPAIQEELVKAQEAVKKFEQDAPVTPCTVTLLEKTMSDYKHVTTTRTEAWKKGAEKAKASEDEVVAAIEEHILEWQNLREAIIADAKVRTTAWKDHHEKVLETMGKVAATLKGRHDTATQVATSQGLGAHETASAVVAAEASATPVSSDEEMVVVEFHEDHWMNVLYSPTEIPDHKEALKKVSPVSKGAMNHMWGVVHAWPMNEGTQLTFAQFGACEGEAFITMKTLIGEAIWKRMYDTRAESITAHDVCPRSFATPMLIALSLASCHLASYEVLEKAIVKSDTDIKHLGVESVAKKRRAA